MSFNRFRYIHESRKNKLFGSLWPMMFFANAAKLGDLSEEKIFIWAIRKLLHRANTNRTYSTLYLSINT